MLACKKIILLCIFFGISLAQAQMMEKQYTVEVEASSGPAAQNLLLDKAIERATVEIVSAYIGEDRLTKNRAVLQKILSGSNEYIPYSKRGELKKIAEKQYQMDVTLRISRDALKEILLKTGLLYENQENPIVMSFISFGYDSSGDSYKWWLADRNSSAHLSKYHLYLEKNLANELWEGQFYLIPGQKKQLAEWLNDELRVNNFNKSHFDKLNQMFKAQIVVIGRIDITSEDDKKPEVKVSLQAIHAINERVIASVNRKLKVDKKEIPEDVFASVAQDMASQIVDVWKKGSLGAQMVLVEFQGKYNLGWLEKFKNELKNESFVKGIRERYLTSSGFSFEIDTHLGTEDFRKKLAEQSLKSAQIKYMSGSDNKIKFEFNSL